MRSCKKLKTLNFSYHNIYHNETCQGSDISLGAPIHKATRPYNHVGSRDKLNAWICTWKKSMCTKLRRVVAFHQGLPSLKTHDLFAQGIEKIIQYSFQLTDTLKGGYLWLVDNFFSPVEFWSKSYKKLSKRRTGN